jgi:hypothetical protein
LILDELTCPHVGFEPSCLLVVLTPLRWALPDGCVIFTLDALEDLSPTNIAHISDNFNLGLDLRNAHDKTIELHKRAHIV